MSVPATWIPHRRDDGEVIVLTDAGEDVGREIVVPFPAPATLRPSL